MLKLMHIFIILIKHKPISEFINVILKRFICTLIHSGHCDIQAIIPALNILFSTQRFKLVCIRLLI